MTKHCKVYFEYFGYDTSDFIPCELCGSKANDVHHIKSRGMGGSKKRDVIENLMALCRKHHEDYGDIAEDRPMLQEFHDNFLKKFNELQAGFEEHRNDYFDSQLP